MNARSTSGMARRFCLLPAVLGACFAGGPVLAAESTSTTDTGASLGEIVVTAQKRQEREQDVPIPVTAISAEALAASNQTRIQDYYQQIPGLTIAPGTFTSAVIAIRGITTGSGSTASTVAVMVDGVPFGSSAHLIVPDFDPSDLSRVEVLRGPQGTLYGTSSLGGLINFVTNDPSTREASGRVEAGMSDVHNGAQLGYTFRAAVNVPLSDAFAVRVSGYTRQDAGYVDNPVLGIDGINKARAAGAHVVALWQPSDVFSVKLSALYQQTKGDGTAEVNRASDGYTGPPLGDLQQNYIPGVGPYARESQAYSAVVTGKLGRVDITSVSGYSVFAFRDSQDSTFGFGDFTQFGVPGTGFTGFGVSGTPLQDWSRTQKFTQELRLSAPIVDRLDGQLGIFYTHEFTSAAQSLLAEDQSTGEILGQTLYTPFTDTYEEYALFADLTYKVTDQFDVQLGGRASRIYQTFNESYFGVYDLCCTPTSPYTQPPESTSSTPVTYLLTPRYKITPDLMLYARIASGYRAGGTNAAGLGVPPNYSPDKTKDYEVGFKGDFLDHTVSVDTSIYYIDWKNIQLNLTNPDTQILYGGNAGGAKSEGIELSAEWRPLRGSKLGAWVAWNEAVLTEPLPAGAAGSVPVGTVGDRLPYSARWSGNLSFDQQFELTDTLSGFAGVTTSFVGARYDGFTSTPLRQYLAPYVKTDLRAGGKYGPWSLNLYANNVTDRRGMISGGLGTGVPQAIYYIEPRTVGVFLARTF